MSLLIDTGQNVPNDDFLQAAPNVPSGSDVVPLPNQSTGPDFSPRAFITDGTLPGNPSPGPDFSRLAFIRTTSAPDGENFQDENVPGPDDDNSEPFAFDVPAMRDIQEKAPLLYIKPNGHLGVTRIPDPETDFTSAAREIYGNDWLGMLRFIASGPEAQRAERERFILGEMNVACEMRGVEIPNFENEIGALADQIGMTEEEYAHWQKRDPEYIANQITDRELLRLSGPGGYVTKLARNPDQKEMARADAVMYAQAEAEYLAQRGDFFAQARYEFGSGIGQAGLLGLRGMAATARLASDFAHWDFIGATPTDKDIFRHAAEWWNEWAKNAEAEWIGPPIDTGRPVFDFVRTSVFQGAPMLGAFVGLSFIPVIGAGGSSAIMGYLMGGDTLLTLRNDGISPALAIPAAAAVGAVSYATNKFTLDNLTRYLGGRSPLRLFSAGTALEVAEEAGQEVIENTTQATAEGLARMIGDPDYNSQKFWNDWKQGFLGSITEGGMAGISTAAMRFLGIPIAARNQIRAMTFATSFSKAGESVAKTEAFKKAPEVLAASMNNMAVHHGGGPVWTSVETLSQAGITREQATAPVAEGGLGVKAEIYDKAAVTGEDVAVGYGNAVVFSQSQKAAGNAAAEGVFSVDPDAMSVGDIRAQQAEAAAIITQAETYYQEEIAGDPETTPLRLKVFKAGMRAGGFSTEQAAALTAMYRSGAERHAEQWGTSVEAWLDQKNVQLMMNQALLSSNRREVTQYLKLLEELNARTATTDAAQASADTAAPAGTADTASETAADTMPPEEAAQGDAVAGVPLEPATTAEEQAAWEADAVETAAAELAEAVGVPEAERPRLVDAVRQMTEAAKPIVEAALPQPELAAATAPAVAVGRESEIIFPSEIGRQPLPVRYELVEADSLQPSHSPVGFVPNPAWPAEFIAQQRNYDSPSMEATRQGIQLSRLDFGALFNPTTDAVNGPPIITPDGLVLGGNNRTLRILNRYDQDNYKTMLTAQLSSRGNVTGIAPDAIAGLNRPVLVRVAENVAAADVPALIGALNADFTTRRDAGNLAANRGMRVGERTLRSFAGIGARTVSAFLNTPEKAFGVVQAMLAEGVFQETDLPTLFDMANGTWLPGGKAQVEQAIFGAVLPDSRLLDEMTPAMQRKLLKALPALVRLKAAGSSELSDLVQAVRWHNEYQDFKETALGKQFKTEAARLEAFRRPDMANMFTGDMETEKSGPAWDMMLDIQKAKSQKEVAEFFTRKADEISGVGRGLFTLQQDAPGGNAVFHDVSNKNVAMIIVDSPTWRGNASKQTKRAATLLKSYRESFPDGILNTDTGWSIGFNSEGIGKTVNFKQREVGFHALEKLPEILEAAVLRKESIDRKNRVGIDGFAVLYAPVTVEGKAYAAEVTVKMRADGSKKFYLQRLKIKEPAVSIANSSAEAAPSLVGSQDVEASHLPPPAGSLVNIAQLLRDVKSEDAPIDNSLDGPSAIETLYHSTNEGEYSSPRGAISFPQVAGDPTIIRLFKGADVSTVVHELNHLFLDDLIKMVSAGRGGEAARRHLDVLNAFTNGDLLSEDDARRRAGFERIASAWERYAMEGIAPSNALAEPFGVFRKYILLAYRGMLNTLEEPSPEVRRVFDAFLATDEEIAAAARRRELRDDWTKAGQSSDAVRQGMDAINARRDDRRRAVQDVRAGGGRQMRMESKIAAIRRTIRSELADSEPAYRALDYIRARGGIDRAAAVAAVGEEAVKNIEVKHGKDVFASDDGDGMVALEEASAFSGYDDDVTGMLADIDNAESLAARADREARMQAESEEMLADALKAQGDEAVGEALDAFSEWWLDDQAEEMTEKQEADADTLDMEAEVDLAIQDQETNGGGRSATLNRDVVRELREWHDARAILKEQARNEISALQLREAVNIGSLRKAKTRAKNNAFSAASRGDKEAVTKWKKQEMYHHYRIVFARDARKLRDRIDAVYRPLALKSAIDAAEHRPRVEFEYAQSIAQLAIYSGFANSRYLRELQGDTGSSPTLVLPAEDPELGGLVTNIADTLPDWLLNKERPDGYRDWRDFTVAQLREIDGLMRWLFDNGRGKLNAFSAKEAANLQDMVNKSTTPMARRPDLKSTGNTLGDPRKRWNRILSGINRFLTSITLPENWFMAMDGNPTISGGEIGFNQRLFLKVVDADVRQGILYEGSLESMKPHFDVLIKAQKRIEEVMGGKLFPVEGLPVPEIMKTNRNISTWDFDLLLSVALYMGNDAGLRRLLSDSEFALRFGYKPEEVSSDSKSPRYNFTNKQLDVLANLFTAEEWDAIQGIWNGVNDLFSEADAVTFSMTNRRVRKEPATSFMVTPADSEGVPKRIAGGYFPLINDPMLSMRADQLNERGDIEKQIRTGTLGNVNGSARRQVGAIKERLRGESGVPLVHLPMLLQTRVLTDHLHTMTHYITHAEILRDLDRMTRDQSWREAYTNKFGQEQYKTIRKWIKSMAAPELGSNSPGEVFMERMRNLATINALGLRFPTGLKQRQGAFQAAAYMTDASVTKSSGWKWLAIGVTEFGRGNLYITNQEKLDFVNGKSDLMRARDGGFDREMRDMQSKLSPLHREYFGHSLRDYQNMAFWWIQANDRAMAYAVWLGAYRQGLAGEANFDARKMREEAAKAGKDMAEVEVEIDRLAVEYADRAAATQASSFAADLTEVQKDRGFMRFMSMFMSGNVRQGSRVMQYIDAHRLGDKTKGDVAWLAIREFVFPALAWTFARATVLFAAAQAFGIGGDDDEDLFKEAFWESLETVAAPFPLARELPSIAHYGFMSGNVPAVNSTVRAVNDLIGAPDKVAEAQYMQAVGKLMSAVGYAFGIPVMNPLNDSGLSRAIGLKPEKKG